MVVGPEQEVYFVILLLFYVPLKNISLIVTSQWPVMNGCKLQAYTWYCTYNLWSGLSLCCHTYKVSLEASVFEVSSEGTSQCTYF